jgi:nicotinic acid mononucleotide adenylyltransferase
LRNLREGNVVIKQAEKLKEKYGIDVTIMPPVWSAVSSSTVKNELKKSGWSDKLHHEVTEYIKKNRLYDTASFGTSK